MIFMLSLLLGSTPGQGSRSQIAVGQVDGMTGIFVLSILVLTSLQAFLLGKACEYD
jgi:hypothetical protein